MQGVDCCGEAGGDEADCCQAVARVGAVEQGYDAYGGDDGLHGE